MGLVCMHSKGRKELKIRTFFDRNGYKDGMPGCWRGHIMDAPGKHEAGTSEAEVIGKLVISHPELFGDVTIECDAAAKHELTRRHAEATD